MLTYQVGKTYKLSFGMNMFKVLIARVTVCWFVEEMFAILQKVYVVILQEMEIGIIMKNLYSSTGKHLHDIASLWWRWKRYRIFNKSLR